MDENLKPLADLLFEKRVIRFGNFERRGAIVPISLTFKKLKNGHRLSFRKSDWTILAEELWSMVLKKGLFFDSVGGFPAAGQQLVKFLTEEVVPSPHCFRLILFSRRKKNRNYVITPVEKISVRAGERLLLFEGFATNSQFLTAALENIRTVGAEVSDMVVVIDVLRCGISKLFEAGCRLHSLFTIQELINYYYSQGLINWDKYQQVNAFFRL